MSKPDVFERDPEVCHAYAIADSWLWDHVGRGRRTRAGEARCSFCGMIHFPDLSAAKDQQGDDPPVILI